MQSKWPNHFRKSPTSLLLPNSSEQVEGVGDEGCGEEEKTSFESEASEGKGLTLLFHKGLDCGGLEKGLYGLTKPKLIIWGQMERSGCGKRKERLSMINWWKEP